jgi:hypothetical protein
MAQPLMFMMMMMIMISCQTPSFIKAEMFVKILLSQILCCVDVFAVAQGIIITQHIKTGRVMRVPQAKGSHFRVKRKISEITLHDSSSFIFMSSLLA